MAKGFIPVLYETGDPAPWEYLMCSPMPPVTLGACLAPSESGTMLTSVTPTHISMANDDAHNLVPTIHIQPTIVFETELASDCEGLRAGLKCDVDSSKTKVDANSTTNQNVQIISFEGKTAGSKVRVRFIS